MQKLNSAEIWSCDSILSYHSKYIKKFSAHVKVNMNAALTKQLNDGLNST